MNVSLYFNPISYDLGRQSFVLLDPALKKRFSLINQTYSIKERVAMLTKPKPKQLAPIVYAFANRDISELEVLLSEMTHEEIFKLCSVQTKGAEPSIWYAVKYQSYHSLQRLLACITPQSLDCLKIMSQICTNGQSIFQAILKSKHKGVLNNIYLSVSNKNVLMKLADKKGNTPLIEAILDKDINTIAWLFKDLSVEEIYTHLTKRNAEGKNAMYYVIQSKSVQLLNVIKQSTSLPPMSTQGKIDGKHWATLLSLRSAVGDKLLSPLAVALYNEGDDYKPLTLDRYADHYAQSQSWSRIWSNKPQPSLTINKKNVHFKEILQGLSSKEVVQCLMDNPDAIIAGFETSKDILKTLRLYCNDSAVYKLCRNAIDFVFMTGQGIKGLKQIFKLLGVEQSLAVVQRSRYTSDKLRYCPYEQENNLTPFMFTLFNRDKQTLEFILSLLNETQLLEQLYTENDNGDSAVLVAIKHFPEALELILPKLSSKNVRLLMFKELDVHGCSLFTMGLTSSSSTQPFIKVMSTLTRHRHINEVDIKESLNHLFNEGLFDEMYQYLNLRAHAKQMNDILQILPFDSQGIRLEWMQASLRQSTEDTRIAGDDTRLTLSQKMICGLLGPSALDVCQLLTRDDVQLRTNFMNLLVEGGHYKVLKGIFEHINIPSHMKLKLLKYKDARGNNPAMAAALKGDWQTLELVLNQVPMNEAVNLLLAENRFGKNALMLLIEQDHTHLLSPILEHFSPTYQLELINSRDSDFYLLHHLAALGHMHLIEMVIEKIPQQTRQDMLRERDRQGRTPFLVALQSRQEQTAASLQFMGGDVFATDPGARNAMHVRGGATNVRRVLAPIDPTPVDLNAPPAWVAPPVIIPREDIRKPVLNSVQSSHDSQVEKDTESSALKLSRLYANSSVTGAISKLSKWLDVYPEQTTDLQTAVRALKYLKQNKQLYKWRHHGTGLTVQDVLAYLWLGLNDKNAQKGVRLTDKDVFARCKRVIDALVNVQRAYNMDSQGNDHGGKDGVSCPGGAFNMFVNGLSGAHDLVEIKIKVNDAVISQKASVVAADIFLNLPSQQKMSLAKAWSKEEGLTEPLWAVIGTQVKQTLVKEFGREYAPKIEAMYDAYMAYMPPPPKVEKALRQSSAIKVC